MECVGWARMVLCQPCLACRCLTIRASAPSMVAMATDSRCSPCHRCAVREAFVEVWIDPSQPMGATATVVTLAMEMAMVATVAMDRQACHMTSLDAAKDRECVADLRKIPASVTYGC